MLLVVYCASDITYNLGLKHTGHKLNDTMLNTYEVLKSDLKMSGIPQQSIYHYKMDKYIKHIYILEKNNFLVRTPYVINTINIQIKL